MLKIAVIYFVVGVGFGMFMSIAADFKFTPVHAHVNLLGWASLALAGLIYHLFPKAANHVLGKIHFWLHNIGLPFMMFFLFMLINTGNTAYETGIAISSSVTALGILAFLGTVLMNVSSSESVNTHSSKSSSM